MITSDRKCGIKFKIYLILLHQTSPQCSEAMCTHCALITLSLFIMFLLYFVFLAFSHDNQTINQNYFYYGQFLSVRGVKFWARPSSSTCLMSNLISPMIDCLNVQVCWRSEAGSPVSGARLAAGLQCPPLRPGASAAPVLEQSGAATAGASRSLSQ